MIIWWLLVVCSRRDNQPRHTVLTVNLFLYCSLPRHSDYHWLASHLVRAPNTRSGGLCSKNSVHWLKVEILLGSGLSTVVTLTWCLSTWLACSHDNVSLSGCVTLAAWRVTGRLTCPTPRQSCVTLAACHVTGRLTCLADSLARHHFATPRCSIPTWYWRELCKEACRDSQTSIG